MKLHVECNSRYHGICSCHPEYIASASAEPSAIHLSKILDIIHSLLEGCEILSDYCETPPLSVLLGDDFRESAY